MGSQRVLRLLWISIFLAACAVDAQQTMVEPEIVVRQHNESCVCPPAPNCTVNPCPPVPSCTCARQGSGSATVYVLGHSYDESAIKQPGFIPEPANTRIIVLPDSNSTEVSNQTTPVPASSTPAPASTAALASSTPAPASTAAPASTLAPVPVAPPPAPLSSALPANISLDDILKAKQEAASRIEKLLFKLDQAKLRKQSISGALTTLEQQKKDLVQHKDSELAALNAEYNDRSSAFSNAHNKELRETIDALKSRQKATIDKIKEEHKQKMTQLKLQHAKFVTELHTVRANILATYAEERENEAREAAERQRQLEKERDEAIVRAKKEAAQVAKQAAESAAEQAALNAGANKEERRLAAMNAARIASESTLVSEEQRQLEQVREQHATAMLRLAAEFKRKREAAALTRKAQLTALQKKYHKEIRFLHRALHKEVARYVRTLGLQRKILLAQRRKYSGILSNMAVVYRAREEQWRADRRERRRTRKTMLREEDRNRRLARKRAAHVRRIHANVQRERRRKRAMKIHSRWVQRRRRLKAQMKKGKRKQERRRKRMWRKHMKKQAYIHSRYLKRVARKRSKKQKQTWRMEQWHAIKIRRARRVHLIALRKQEQQYLNLRDARRMQRLRMRRGLIHRHIPRLVASINTLNAAVQEMEQLKKSHGSFTELQRRRFVSLTEKLNDLLRRQAKALSRLLRVEQKIAHLKAAIALRALNALSQRLKKHGSTIAKKARKVKAHAERLHRAFQRAVAMQKIQVERDRLMLQRIMVSQRRARAIAARKLRAENSRKNSNRQRALAWNQQLLVKLHQRRVAIKKLKAIVVKTSKKRVAIEKAIERLTKRMLSIEKRSGKSKKSLGAIEDKFARLEMMQHEKHNWTPARKIELQTAARRIRLLQRRVNRLDRQARNFRSRIDKLKLKSRQWARRAEWMRVRQHDVEAWVAREQKKARNYKDRIARAALLSNRWRGNYIEKVKNRRRFLRNALKSARESVKQHQHENKLKVHERRYKDKQAWVMYRHLKREALVQQQREQRAVQKRQLDIQRNMQQRLAKMKADSRKRRMLAGSVLTERAGKTRKSKRRSLVRRQKKCNWLAEFSFRRWLGRTSDPRGKRFWAFRCMRGCGFRCLAAGFKKLPEYTARRNRARRCRAVVHQAFRKHVGRVPRIPEYTKAFNNCVYRKCGTRCLAGRMTRHPAVKSRKRHAKCKKWVQSSFFSLMGRKPARRDTMNLYKLCHRGCNVKCLRTRIMRSTEYRVRTRNDKCHTRINMLYRQILKRNPDAGGYKHWLNRCVHHKCGVKCLSANLYKSPEYRSLCTRWVPTIFRSTRKRAPRPSETKMFVTRCQTRRCNYGCLAKAIGGRRKRKAGRRLKRKLRGGRRSRRGRRRLRMGKKLKKFARLKNRRNPVRSLAKIPIKTCRAWVTAAYKKFLRRKPDAGGFNHWVHRCHRWRCGRKCLRSNFRKSDEYKKLKKPKKPWHKLAYVVKPKRGRQIHDGKRFTTGRSVGYTLAFWVNPTGVRRTLSTLVSRGANVNQRRVPAAFFHPHSTRLLVSASSARQLRNDISLSKPFRRRTWAHVAITHCRKGHLRVYVNGKLAGKKQGVQPVANAGPFWIGDNQHVAASAILYDVRYMKGCAPGDRIRGLYMHTKNRLPKPSQSNFPVEGPAHIPCSKFWSSKKLGGCPSQTHSDAQSNAGKICNPFRGACLQACCVPKQITCSTHYAANGCPAGWRQNDQFNRRCHSSSSGADSCDRQCCQFIPAGQGKCSYWGDPHLISFDGRHYDCHTPGEYLMFGASAEDEEVHVQQEKLPQPQYAHVPPLNVGMAFRDRRNVISMFNEPPQWSHFVMTMRYNGRVIPYPTRRIRYGNFIMVPNGGALPGPHFACNHPAWSHTSLSIFNTRTHTSVHVHFRHWCLGMRYYDVEVTHGRTSKLGKPTQGLCGTWDRNPNNDLVDSKGASCQFGNSNACCLSWRVPHSKSLFRLPDESLDMRGLCAPAVKCPVGWNDVGLAGHIHVNGHLHMTNFPRGGAFNSGWTWTHPRMCCASGPNSRLEGLAVYGKSCADGTHNHGMGGLILRNDFYAYNPFHRGGGFNSGWTWTHPHVCPVHSHVKLMRSGGQFCMLGSAHTCPTGWQDFGYGGVIDNQNRMGNLPPGGGFNSHWWWRHPRICCTSGSNIWSRMGWGLYTKRENTRVAGFTIGKMKGTALQCAQHCLRTNNCYSFVRPATAPDTAHTDCTLKSTPTVNRYKEKNFSTYVVEKDVHPRQVCHAASFYAQAQAFCAKRVKGTRAIRECEMEFCAGAGKKELAQELQLQKKGFIN